MAQRLFLYGYIFFLLKFRCTNCYRNDRVPDLHLETTKFFSYEIHKIIFVSIYIYKIIINPMKQLKKNFWTHLDFHIKHPYNLTTSSKTGQL